MRDIGIRVLAGICGAALFAILNGFFLTLSGTFWAFALVATFAAAFVAALIVQRSIRSSRKSKAEASVGSRNVAGGAMKVSVDGLPNVDAEKSKIGSENKSAGDMNVAIKSGSGR